MDYCAAENLYEMVRLKAWKFVGFADTLSRLNTKIEPRELVVKDLVADLSDGVSTHMRRIYDRADLVYAGHSYSSTRMPFERVSRPICRKA
jgi:hypothetical protein